MNGAWFRFQVMVTAVWARGSNADIALDYIALGAACFDTGTLNYCHGAKLTQTLCKHFILSC